MKKTLNELREEQRYTIKALAEGAGIPYGSCVGYVYRTRTPKVEYAKMLADFLGVDVNDIDFSRKAE